MTAPREQLARLAGYVPFHALVAVLEQPEREFLPLEGREGAVLRAELTGLASMAQALSSRGRAGAEELSQVLSGLFSGLLEGALFPADGYLLRFGGETLTAFFEGKDAAARAAWCARTMIEQARAFATVQTAAGVRSIKLRAGVATGPFSLVYLGIGHDRVSCVPGGATVQRALECAAAAQPGTVVADPATFEAAQGARARAAVKAGTVLGAVLDVAPEIARAPVRMLEKDLARAPQAALERLMPLVPEELVARMDSKGPPLCELRRSTVLVARLVHADWDSQRALADARAAGEVFHNAVLAIRRTGGVVGPVEAALDGFRLQATFTAPAARGDAERAARCALELRGLGLAVALEMGSVFTGEVGTGLKRELAVFGDGVDLAARFLSLARLGDAVLGPVARTQLFGFGIEALPEVAVAERGSPTAPALLLAAPEPQALRTRPRTESGAGLIDRARELSALRDVGAAVRSAGRAAAVLVSGPTGVGKSALVDAYAAEWSAAGGSAAIARLTFADSERPWALAGRLMRQLLRLPSDTDPGKAPGAVSRLDRRLSPVAPYASVLLGAPGTATPEAVGELLERIIAHRAADAPLLLGIDNAHHADLASAQVWERIAERLAARPVLWVAASASGAQQALKFAALSPAHIELAGLDREGALSLLSRLAPDLSPEQVLRCAAAGEGNPFLMLSAARIARARGGLPDRPDLAGAWALGLDEDPRVLAELVAAFGGARASVEVLYEALHAFDRRANGRDAIAALEKRELLERRLGKVRFRSRAVQEQIYAQLPKERLQALHGAVGRALKLIEPESPAALFAFHFARSDSLPEAVRSCMRAGEEALRAGALREAADFFGKAAHAAERSRAPELADALARQARAQVRLGSFAQARALSERAVQAARSAGRSHALAEALGSAAQAAYAEDDLDGAATYAREAAEAVPWAKNPELAVEVFGLASAIEAALGRPRASLPHARKALRSARQQNAPSPLARARAALGAAAWAGGHLHGAARELAEAQRLFNIAGEPARALEAAAMRAWALASMGQAEAALNAAQSIAGAGDVAQAVLGMARLAEGLAYLELRRAREAEGALADAGGRVTRRLRARCLLYGLLAQAMCGVGGAEEQLASMARSSADADAAHGWTCAARAAVERGDPVTAAERIRLTEPLARQHARELLPALARLKARLAARPVAQA